MWKTNSSKSDFSNQSNLMLMFAFVNILHSNISFCTQIYDKRIVFTCDMSALVKC